MRKSLLITLKITFIGVYAALVYALQVALASIPNVELVTLMLSIAGLCMHRYMSMTIALIFVLLEALTYGFGDWVILYIIVWPLLTLSFSLFKKYAEYAWVLVIAVNTIFGFLFGAIDAGIKYLLYDQSTMIAYWIKGLVFDLIHGVGNFMIALLCFKPVYAVVSRYCKKYINAPLFKIKNFDFKIMGCGFCVSKFYI
ncbi:hypothetical protein ESOMN_v1c00830 [Williamsoniiplasma somnilux]|uniref:Energy-coupling factor transport system substrate-specific component n=1 Tax=Williamsoniiplasma somnilux TaxID=215578 RepID=A0A2K8NZ27_9MOLU|nr:hypothetical protein [Williamsoniiplasma somnilux]ATZ18468.1 hypothetical protein ESOMN_v1c00830 [Williamsoniiplasma somnilux]